MRYEFGKVIAELAAQDPDIHLIVGDIGYQVFDEFRQKFPTRFHNVGVCEQAMIGLAAGMALGGLKPWVYTITTFLIERPFEQVKIDINQQKANVKLVGYADYPELGPTHILIDERVVDNFKNIKTYYPKNSAETRQAATEAHFHQGPVFISLKKDNTKAK